MGRGTSKQVSGGGRTDRCKRSRLQSGNSLRFLTPISRSWPFPGTRICSAGEKREKRSNPTPRGVQCMGRGMRKRESGLRAVRMVQNPLGGRPVQRDVPQWTVFSPGPDQAPRGKFVPCRRSREARRLTDKGDQACGIFLLPADAVLSVAGWPSFLKTEATALS